MSELKLYRKRIIPQECVLLGDDIVLYQDDKIIVTKWKTLRPKKNFTHGFSCYFLEKGYKVSKFLRADDSLLYWYCDIIDYEHNADENSYIFRDLLVDVLIYPDDFVEVDDIDELEKAIAEGGLKVEDMLGALKSLSSLLDTIYGGKFAMLTREIEMRI